MTINEVGISSLLGLAAAFIASPALADGPADNVPDKVRAIPPPGVSIPDDVRVELQKRADELAEKIRQLQVSLANRPALADLLPDIEIFHIAINGALKYNEIYNPANEIPAARELLDHGVERASQLEAGIPGWVNATGLIVRGYRSRIDGSIQPYGLVVPPGVAASRELPRRLDAWFHGRDEKLTELNFLAAREKSPGEFVPPDAFVLHLYGRYCNANKFAGEIDLLEALDDVKRRYAIDDDRIVVRGFSMGGAACWQFAVHFAGNWAAAAPGAGFSETAEFLKVFQNESVRPPPWEQKLWHWYDCTDYAENLFNCPTIAYSGEIDRQKQAADVMAKALAAEGIELTHIIGPQTPHRYHPDSKREIDRRIDLIARRGRERVPAEVRFSTWTLRYNKMLWVTVDELEQHWERARVGARITDPRTVDVTAKNVNALTLDMPAGYCPLDRTKRPTIRLNGSIIEAPAVQSDRSWRAHLRKRNGEWKLAESDRGGGLRKRHGLQGPIDDAFMDSFVMVVPTGEPINEPVANWVAAEQRHAIEHWRKQFRGEARVVKDVEVTDDQIRDSNLILWGDPQSNTILGRIAAKLPIQWDKMSIHLGESVHPADQRVPLLIYPNPLNPARYVVLNSGFTFREYDYLNNARQVAKLPDYAIIDITKPVTSRYPGEVVQAGFFSESWEMVPRAP